MSYLHPTRLTFFGRFQADISTVNNDVRHFDNKTFLPRFQKLQSKTDPSTLNGWFNPNGSGAFRLVDCRVTSASYGDGRTAQSRDDDPIVGMSICSADDAVAGKLVDIDPQWQLASAIFGARVRLVGPDGEEIMGGDYEPAPFRDLWFGRDNVSGGDGGASSIFQSVLTGVDWGKGSDASPWLKELRSQCGDGPLSIRLMTLGYEGNIGEADFTLGWVSGVIGPAEENEPHASVLGRRMVVAGDAVNEQGAGKPANSFGLSFFDCAVVGSTLLADFSNGLATHLSSGSGRSKGDPLASDAFPATPFQPLGDLELAVLHAEDIKEGDVLTPAQFTSLAVVPYGEPRWLEGSGGILSVNLSPEQAKLVAGEPLAVLRNAGAASATVAMRESADGWNVRVDNFVQRVQPHSESDAVRVYAARFGVPAADTAIEFHLSPIQKGLGGSGQSQPKTPSAPAAKIPPINTPAHAVTVPASLITDAHGRVDLAITATDPGNVRVYIDSQLYLVKYGVKGHHVDQQMFDVAVFLVFSGYDEPASPTWSDVQPVLTQYANLYPIMSRYLVDLSDEEDVKKHAKIIQFAMSMSVTDPNYMPATRDLSDARRSMVLKWLSSFGHIVTPGDGSSQLKGRPHSKPVEASSDVGSESPLGGKSTFYQGLLRSRSNHHSS